MLRALITGGGSKFGAAFVKELEKTHEIEIIPRAVLKGIGQKYNARHNSYDLVFFNHHAYPEAFDVPTYEQNCLVNLRILESINLHTDRKVFWMTSFGMPIRQRWPTDDYTQWAPYFAMKAMNVHIMKWLHHMKTYDGTEVYPMPPKPIANYYGIDPGHMIDDHWDTPAKRVHTLVQRDDLLGGRVYTLRGELSDI